MVFVILSHSVSGPGTTRQVFSMVAGVQSMPEASSPISGSKSGDPSGSSSMSSTTLTIGKVFGHCDKLNKDNYEVWLAGLLSAIAGLTIVSEFYVQLEKTID